MEQEVAETLKFVVDFKVRHDKYRGILLESFSVEGIEYFFKYQDQSIDRHCTQMQSIVRRSNVKRSKKLLVDVTAFFQEYYLGGKYVFRGTELTSTQQQIEKVIALTTNKEIGAKKRSITYAANKAKKTEERNSLLWAKYGAMEDKLREEREKKMKALFGQDDQGAPEVQSTSTQKEVEAKNSKPVCTVPPATPRQVQLDQILHEAMNTDLPEDNEFPENVPTEMETTDGDESL